MLGSTNEILIKIFAAVLGYSIINSRANLQNDSNTRNNAENPYNIARSGISTSRYPAI